MMPIKDLSGHYWSSLVPQKNYDPFAKILKIVQWMAEMDDYFFFSMKLNESTK